MTTTKLVTIMLNESIEVKHSTGGNKIYRQIMDFILFTGITLDFSVETGHETGRLRKHSEIAKILKANFSKEEIEIAKNISGE